MPIYEYRCENGHLFEVLQRMTDDPVTVCQECGAPVQRVLHPVAVHFKGKGFYNTDYGTKKRQRELKSAAEGPGSGSGSSDGASGDSGSGGGKDAGSSSGSGGTSDSGAGGGSKSESSSGSAKKDTGSSS